MLLTWKICLPTSHLSFPDSRLSAPAPEARFGGSAGTVTNLNSIRTASTKTRLDRVWIRWQ
jgi:hypothetical protein